MSDMHRVYVAEVATPKPTPTDPKAVAWVCIGTYDNPEEAIRHTREAVGWAGRRVRQFWVESFVPPSLAKLRAAYPEADTVPMVEFSCIEHRDVMASVLATGAPPRCHVCHRTMTRESFNAAPITNLEDL